MIELYYWPTPNGHKITLFLEEGPRLEQDLILLARAESVGATHVNARPGDPASHCFNGLIESDLLAVAA